MRISSTRGAEWAAGLFEGEGTIGLRKRPENQLYLQLSSTDEDVVRDFCRVVEAGKVYGPYQYGENRKPFWKWNCAGASGADVLRLLLPWLGDRRAERAEEVLAAWEARRGRPHYTVSRKGIGGRPTHRA